MTNDTIEKIEDKYLYIVTTISLKKKTELDRKKDFELKKYKYPRWRAKTYEDYCELLQSLKKYDYEINQEDNSYYLDLNKAREIVLKNIGDINDGGVYNYVVIKKICLNKVYANVAPEDAYLFRFCKNMRLYKEISLNEDNEAKFIADYISPLLISDTEN